MPFNTPPPGRTPPRKDNGGLATLVQAEKLMQIAIMLPSSAFIGWLLGALLDKWSHQTWISLAGLVFGGIAGLVYVVRLVMATGSDSGSSSRGGGSDNPL